MVNVGIPRAYRAVPPSCCYDYLGEALVATYTGTIAK